MTGGHDEDPILLAGAVQCAWCGGEAYPVEVAWLTGELLLATFTQPHRAECRGPRAWTMIMDTDTGPGHAFSHAPRDNSRRPRATCRGNLRGASTVQVGTRQVPPRARKAFLYAA